MNKEKILKWCGWEILRAGYTDYEEKDAPVSYHPILKYVYSDGGSAQINHYPDLDMNFYFKYAQPKMRKEWHYTGWYGFMENWIADIFEGGEPAEAFGEALSKVIEEEP